jgi:hypothetical protein
MSRRILVAGVLATLVAGTGATAHAQPPAEGQPTEEAAAPPPGDVPAEVPPPPDASEGQPPGDGGAGTVSEMGEVDEAETDSGDEISRIFNTRIYGYIDAYWQYETDTPNGIDPMTGQTIVEAGAMEWDVLNLHVMAQGTILNRFRYFVNLASPQSGSPIDDEVVGVRNAWVEVPIFGNYLNVRAGKTYRRFGLYNEILDAVPTFIGIEPPELFDRDHLLLTRTTNFMVHGSFTFDEHTISYAVTTGQDENSWNDGLFPIGADLRYDFGTTLRVGSSFYHTGGFASPSRAVGDGSPRGGVLNWMARDQYWIIGGYAQLQIEGLILQGEYWHASHDAFRDPASVRTMLDDPASGITSFQRPRFEDPGGPMGVRERVRYAVDTFYFRAGYEFDVGDLGTLTPYE